MEGNPQTNLQEEQIEKINKYFGENNDIKELLQQSDLDGLLGILGIKRRGLGKKTTVEISNIINVANNSKALDLKEEQVSFLAGYIKGATLPKKNRLYEIRY